MKAKDVKPNYKYTKEELVKAHDEIYSIVGFQPKIPSLMRIDWYEENLRDTIIDCSVTEEEKKSFSQETQEVINYVLLKFPL